MTTVEYNECVDLYADKVYRFIRKSTGENDQSKDIVQDAFVKLWQKRADVRFESVKSYLFTVAYRVMIDHFRSRKRMNFTQNLQPEQLFTDNQYSDLKEVLNKAIDCLPAVQKDVILLRDYEGYSYDEISVITGLNASQVKVYIYRGRKTLKNILVKLNVEI